MIERLDNLLRPSRTTVYPVIILVMWCVAWAAILGTGSQPLIVDFVARWTGGRLALTSDPDLLYDPRMQFDVQREVFAGETSLSWFVSPPFEALVLIPFGLLPFPVAGVIWTALSLSAWVVSLLLLRSMLDVRLREWRRFVLLAMASMAFLELVFSGQNTAFVLLWIVSSYVALRADRPFLAGALLGLALIKPHLVVLIPVLWLLERRWRALAGLLAITTLWTGLSWAVFGSAGLSHWLETLQSGVFVSEVHIGQALKHAGLSGFLTAVLPPGAAIPWASLPTLMSVGVGLIAIVYIWRRASDLALRWWLVVLVSLVVAPHAMVYDFVLAVPGIALALRRWWVPQLRVLAALTWIVFWVYPPLAIGLAQMDVLSSLVNIPWHAVSLLVLVLVILRRLGTEPECRPPTTPMFVRASETPSVRLPDPDGPWRGRGA